MEINGATEVYGIIGNPVSHSLSPAMHNAAFLELELNKVYIPIPTKEVSQVLLGIKAMGIKGASVTIPHKQTVIPYLDSIDPIAEKIGAVNTLIVQDNNTLHGCNTDWIGANKSLTDCIDIQKRKVLLIGAGGSARAIGFGLLEAGAELIIANRTQSTGEELAELLNCPFVPLADVESVEADVLVNTTSVGMTPNEETTPIDQTALNKFTVVMDIIYAPLKSRLLQEAERAGCKTVNGIAMLLYQGAAQFELWTGKSAPIEVMRAQLLAGLEPQ